MVQEQDRQLLPLDEPRFVFDLGHVVLRAHDHIAHALTGDAVVLGDLGQRQVLVIVEIVEFLLAVGEKLSIKVEEHRHAKGLVFHGKFLLVQILL